MTDERDKPISLPTCLIKELSSLIIQVSESKDQQELQSLLNMEFYIQDNLEHMS